MAETLDPAKDLPNSEGVKRPVPVTPGLANGNALGAETPALLELSKLQLVYPLGEQTLTVLRQIDLRILPGQMVAILGPSGSGKSTLLYILGCLLKPSSGSYRLAGEEVSQLDSESLAEFRSRKIGFIFQQFHLLPRANVLENVLLPSRYVRTPDSSEAAAEKHARSLLETVGLSSHLEHHPSQLSGGQQQRVAIARALMNDPALILADEPTGNLDSRSAEQVLDLLQNLNRQGRTIIIITHDHEVAAKCERVVTIRDGVLEDNSAPVLKGVLSKPMLPGFAGEWRSKAPTTRSDLNLSHWRRYTSTAIQNLLRNKGRSALTMLGVTIGIAAVLSTVTLGTFTRTRILQTYESLGVNKLVIRAYTRWNLKAKDLKGPKFDGVSKDSDIPALRRLFPEIRLISPVINDWITSVEFGGRSFDQPRMLGVSPEYFAITNRHLLVGQPFTRYHNDQRSRVCVIGYDIAKRLFGQVSPLRQILTVNGQDNKNYSCQILGVLESQSSNSEWFNPNQQVLVPDNFLSIMANQWNAKPHEFDLQIASGKSIEELSKKIKGYFYLTYGRSADVRIDSDGMLIAQMRKFLDLFAVLLAAVAFISLAVGGIGITNMMLVSVAERFKEIGLRKALGARDREIFIQFLFESTTLCFLAGIAGVVFGTLGYHSALFLASKLFSKVQFEWVFNAPAIILSVLCIFVVGVASGVVPAIRAQKLEVVTALRSE